MMATRLSFDRFEGKGKQIAVLVADDGATLNVPKSLLPPGAKPGGEMLVPARSRLNLLRRCPHSASRLNGNWNAPLILQPAQREPSLWPNGGRCDRTDAR